MSELLEKFANPSSAYRGKPFWAWNDKLEPEELRRQLRIFKRMGLGGGFMHSRVGLKTPYLSSEWFDCIKACIDEAKKHGLEAWLYDEDRWPSGAAGGLVTKDEKYRLRFLTIDRHEKPESFLWPESGEESYIFGAIFEEDGRISWYQRLYQPEDILILPQKAEILQFTVTVQKPSCWYNNQTYLDTLSEDAVRRFIEVTFEAYKEHVGEEFGKTVPGIFTDEPNNGYFYLVEGENLAPATPPWTAKFAERFREMFGYDVTRHLPEIAFDLTDKKFSQVRYHYNVCRTRLFVESFAKQIGDWCESNNLLFTGHVLMEWALYAQASVVGSAMQFYAYMQAPGIDVLTQYKLEYSTAKQCSSVARQMGRKWVLSELYGCTGWDTTFETYKHSGDWQAVLGVNLRCQHLSWYSMAGEAKRDYPASIHIHSPWWQQFKFVEDYFSRVNTVITEGRAVCDLAVIHPIETYYMLLRQFETRKDAGGVFELDKKHNQLVSWLLGGHLDFDFADEHLLVELNASVGTDEWGAYLQIGQMRYRAVLVPQMITIRKTTLELLNQFREAGGKVVFVEDVPECVDGAESSAAREFAEGGIVGFDFDEIISTLEDKVRKVSIRTEAGEEVRDVFYQFRKIGDDWVIFMVNTNRQKGYENLSVKLQLELPKGGQIQYWDAISGKRYKLAGELTYKTASFNVDISASGSAIVYISSEPEQELESLSVADRRAGKAAGLEINPSSWEVLLDDYNPLVLDRADFEMRAEGKKKLSKSKTEILQIDRTLREYLDIPLRGGAMAQPWVEADNPLGPSGHLKLTYRFNVKYLPTEVCLLAIEQPERWEIKLNGNVIPSEAITGWWVDKSIKTLPVKPEFFVKGKNVIEIEGQFDRLADLEIIYVLGKFGVMTNGKLSTITKPVNKLKLGNWVEQGLAFYSGNVIYRTSVTLDKKDKKYFIEFGEFSATGIEVSVNGKSAGIAGWPEYRIDVTENLADGKNIIDIKLLGSRRNAFGPLHINTDNPRYTSPGSFVDSSVYQEEYRLLSYGLYSPPVLVAYDI